MTTTTNHRIWPGPECPKTRELQPVDHQRSRGIAMGHVRASARMRRFVVWLLSYSACAERAALRTGLSPEGAVRSGSLYELQWLATRVLHGRWREAFREPVNVEAELLALLASPEWLSLPWQRESEGVGRG